MRRSRYAKEQFLTDEERVMKSKSGRERERKGETERERERERERKREREREKVKESFGSVRSPSSTIQQRKP